MPKITKSQKNEERFSRKGRDVIIHRIGDKVALEIDGKTYPVKFLDNGRPYTKAYVNVMATDVRDYAEKFIDFTVNQETHWETLAKKSATE